MRTWLVALSVVVASVFGGVVAATTPPAGTGGEAASALAPTVGQVEANGVTLAYESFGSADGETILLIAGSGMQLTGWPAELIADLVGRGYRVVAYDNRGVGGDPAARARHHRGGVRRTPDPVLPGHRVRGL